MAQQNRIQDGTVVFSAADPSTYDLGFNIQGNANITKTLVVSQSNTNDGRISTSTGVDLLLTNNAGAPANIRLQPATGGNILLNNVAWLDNTPNSGGFIGASGTNALHYYPFIAGNEVSDTLTTTYLNSHYPSIVPGQMVAGSTVVYLNVGLGTWRFLSNNGSAGTTQSIMLAASDETTALTSGTAKVTFRMPYAFTLTQLPRINLTTAATGATLLQVNIKKNGTTIFTTNLTTNAGATTSTTATTPAVLTTVPTVFADDDAVTVDIVAVGSTIAGAGLKVTLIGHS